MIDSKETAQIHLSENKVVETALYGLAILDCSCYSEKDEFYQNTKGGILISGTEKLDSEKEMKFYEQYPLRNIINAGKINNNKDAGIFVNGGIKGPIIVN